MAITYKLELNSKPKKDNTCGILLRITENRKYKRFSTGVFVLAKDFNKKAEAGKWIRRSNPEYQKLNERLKTKIKEAEEAETKLSKNNQVATAKNIISEVKHKTTGSFIKYYEEKLEQYKQTKSAGTYKHMKSKLNNLKLFQEEITFPELSVSFLNKYQAHLIKNELNENSVTSNLRAIRTILYEAFKEDTYEGKNPFLKLKLREIKANKEKLSLDEIKKIEALELEENTQLWHVKNYFLFAFYEAGIRIGDFMQLQWKNIDKDKLSYTMDKTSEAHEVIIKPKAKKILELYKKPTSKPNDYIFPILDNQLQKADNITLNNAISSKNAVINKALKRIAIKAKIKLNLTFHISRHSFADILRHQKVNIYDIKDLLGHSDIKITQKYLKSMDRESANEAHSKADL